MDSTKKMVPSWDVLGKNMFDVKNCTESTSQTVQVSEYQEIVRQKQLVNFNLGSGVSTTDPLHAAALLLEREYKDTGIFLDGDNVKATFIPEGFISHVHFQQQPMITYNLSDILNSSADNALINEPNFWLSKEMQTLKNNGDNFSKTNLKQWLVKVHLIMLVEQFSQHSVEEVLQSITATELGLTEIIEIMSVYFQNHSPSHWFSEAVYFISQKTNLDFNKIDDWSNEVKLKGIVAQYSEKILSSSHSGKPNVLIDDCTKLMSAVRPNHFLSKQLKRKAKKRQAHPASSVRDILSRSEIKKEPVIAEHWLLQELNVLNSHFGNILGDFVEHWLYDELKKCFNEIDSDDIVVLSGCDITLLNAKPKARQEFDFIVMSAKRKMITIIEVKLAFTSFVFQQLERCHKVLEESFGDIFDSGWSVCRSVCFYISSTIPMNEVPANAHKFIITENTSIGDWWSKICQDFQRIPESEVPTAKIQMQNALKVLLFGIHAGSGPTVTSKVIGEVEDKLEKISSTDNIIFFSRRQLPLMKGTGEKYRHVMFKAGYGAGKTTMIASKCEMMAGEKTLFLMWSSGFSVKKTLLMEKLTSRWNKDSHSNIVLMTTGQLKAEVGGSKDYYFHSRHLLSYIQQCGPMHVFIDEWRWYHETESTEDFLHLIQELENRYFWISWRRDTIINWEKENHQSLREVCEENFVIPSLSFSMRNARYIVDAARDAAGKTARDVPHQPDNFPEGVPPSIVHLEDMRSELDVKAAFREAITAARKYSSNGILILVNDDQRYCPGEYEVRLAIKCIKQICIELNEPCSGYFLFSDYENDSFGNPEEYLTERKGVLITDQRAAEGFEAESLIAYGGNSDTTANHSSTNFFMRCIANLVIINESVEAKKMRLLKLKELELRRARDHSTFELRLHSYQDWSGSANSPDPKELASAGFFYIGDKCLVQCISCNCCVDFQSGGDPMTIHRAFENCDFMKGIFGS